MSRESDCHNNIIFSGEMELGCVRSEQCAVATSGNVCPVSKCRKKIKKGCSFQVCRNCCLKLQNNIDKETLSLKHRHPSLTLWLEENKYWVQEHLAHNFQRDLLLCQAHKTKAFKHREQTGITLQAQPKDNTSTIHKSSSALKGNAVLETTKHKYHSAVKVLLIGIGADEQLGGYGRHRSAYLKGGEQALRQELSKDMERLWTRNLGRDDRCVSDHGREARFPFLDEDVVSYVRSLPIQQIVDLRLPSGVGDKRILRDAAKKIGLKGCSGLVKRAIQFGSRIAKHSNIQMFGSNRKGKGESKFVVN